MFPHAGIKAFFTAVRMNKGENSAELLCGECFIGKTYNQKIVQNAFHDDFGLKNREQEEPGKVIAIRAFCN